MSILDYVPKPFTAREHQVYILKQVEEYYNKYDVLVIPGDVGTGKSLIDQTIALWRASFGESTATVIHRVALQQQYTKDFPYLPILMGRGRYTCNDDEDLTCEDHFDIFKSYCEGCNYICAKNTVKTSKNAVFNFQSYLLNQEYKDNLIVDEAHNLIPVMCDEFSLMVWKHKHDYPDDLETHGETAIWIEGVLKKDLVILESLEKDYNELRVHAGIAHGNLNREQKVIIREYKSMNTQIKRYKKVLDGLQRSPANFFIEHSNEEYHGVMKPCLKVRPTTLVGMPNLLWPESKTKKIILMSGTISKMDIKLMGLSQRRIKILDCPNPIPAEQCPILVDNCINMSYKFQDKNLQKMANKIVEILEKHPNSKGIVHTTYGLAKKIKPLLKHNTRLSWHDKKNKEAKLQELFKNEENQVLMACGFSEGIDLAGPDYEFQIIMKIQWPSKADKLVSMLYNTDIKRVIWETVRTTRQQIGRICRGPTDKGTTYILDAAFGNIRLKRKGLIQQSLEFWPENIMERIKWL